MHRLLHLSIPHDGLHCFPQPGTYKYKMLGYFTLTKFCEYCIADSHSWTPMITSGKLYAQHGYLPTGRIAWYRGDHLNFQNKGL